MKIDARNFETIHDILRRLSLVQSLLKGRNALIWHIGNLGVNCIYFLFQVAVSVVFGGGPLGPVRIKGFRTFQAQPMGGQQKTEIERRSPEKTR